MSVEEEYYINLHVGGKFVHDPHFRYLGGEMDNLTVVWNDSSTIDMINYWNVCNLVVMVMNVVRLLVVNLVSVRV
ncbi:hypothetical protein Gohar_027026, partial [Gossypium harknessii]|nr:hypothetical protein [Gossypium harknessii]